MAINLALVTPSHAITSWNSDEGINRFNNSKYKNDFYQLANFYQAQINPIYCAAATALIIKNALYYPNIPSQTSSQTTKPNGEIIPFNLYLNQNEFFNDKTDKIKERAIINYQKPLKKSGENTAESYDPGLNLSDFKKFLSIHRLKAKINYVSDNSLPQINQFRDHLKKILTDKNKFLIANFDGKIFQAKTNGHISPIVAYDENSDSILVLDVALHKNTWYWIELNKMIEAMHSKDGDNFRGYLIVEKKYFF